MKRNFLWINLDQIRVDTLGAYGNRVCRTPNIDRLARSGVRFDRAYTPCSLCTPARASMYTGRYAFTNGMGTNCDMYHSLARELPDPSMLLHSQLAERGYRTVFEGKWHVGTDLGPRHYGFEGMDIPGYGNIRANEGFRAYLDRNGYTYEIRPEIFMNPNEKTLYGGLWDGPTESTPPAYLASETIATLESLVSKTGGTLSAGDAAPRCESNGEPFLLICNFWGPHSPHLPSREYYRSHDRTQIEPWQNFDDPYRDKPQRITTERNDFYRSRPNGWDEWRELVGLYYDFTSMIDAEVGRILDAADRLGLNGTTNIILTTDHGDMTGSHNQLLDKGFLYEEAHHIPLIASGPWVSKDRAGTASEALVSNMDVFPSILDAVETGCVDSLDLDGRPFLHELDRSVIQGVPSRSMFLMEFHGIRYLYSQRAIVTDDGWKYIFTPGDIDEVYNLNTDPGEMHNLLRNPDYADVVSTLQERIMQAVVEAGDPIMDAVYKLLGRWENPSGQIDASKA